MTAVRDLLLVGAGGLGRETAAAVRAVNAVSPTFALGGFLDDDPALAGATVDGLPVLGPVDRALVDARPEAAVVVCTGSAWDPSARRRIVERLGLPAERSATIRHPSAVLADGCTIGGGGILLASVVATTAVAIGAHAVLMPTAVLTHDDVLGRFVTLGAGVRLAGGVVVGDGAYLGAGALVREGCRIGERSVIGMGAVVLHDVPPGEVWAGNPARRLRTVEEPSPSVDDR